MNSKKKELIKNSLKKIRPLERIVWHTNNIIAIERQNKLQKERKKLRQREMESVICRPIVSSDKCGTSVMTLKEETIETLPLVPCFELYEGGEASFKIPKMEIRCIENAQVFPHSDIVLTDEYAIWNKYFDEQRFEMTIPKDSNLAYYKDGSAYMYMRKASVTVDNGFTICGMYDDVFGHFMIQYLPKIYILSSLKEFVKEKITIIAPEIKDKQMKGLIERHLSKLENVELLMVDSKDSVVCRNLYYWDKSMYFIEDSDIYTIAAWLMPKYTADLIKENMCKDLNKYDQSPKPEHPKLFLTRREQKWSLMTNIKEVEDYFETKGFKIIEPHKLTLDEKLTLFRNAEIIVTLPGSACMNFMFCKPGTKIMSLGAYTLMHTCINLLSWLQCYWNLEALYVLGANSDNTVHSDFSIPIERIEKAYKKLCDI